MKRRDFLRLALCSGGATISDWYMGSSIILGKEVYPAKKITWVANTFPGGGFDLIPRAMAPYMKKYFSELVPGCKGGEIVIRNEPAAAGVKAYGMIYQAKPDGYTLGGFEVSFISDIVTGKVDKSNFDVTKFTYIARLRSTNKVVIASKDGLKSWKDAVALSKKSTLKIGVGQFGRMNHIAGIIIKEALDLNAKFISTRSTVESTAMLMRGDVHVVVASEDSVSHLLESGEIHTILSCKDKSEEPGVVTLKELGYTEIGERTSSHLFAVGPPGLPKETVNVIIEAIKKTMSDSQLRDWAIKARVMFSPVYGNEATLLAKKYIDFYEGMETTLKKHLL